MQYNDIDQNEINKIKQGLTELGNSFEAIANRTVPVQRIEDRQLTGNAIQGGKITQFESGQRSEEIDFKGGFYQRRKKKKEEKEGKNG